MRDINLVPQYVLDHNRKIENKSRVVIYGAMAGVILLLAAASPQIMLLQLKPDVADLQRRVDALQEFKKRDDLLNSLKTDAKMKEQVVASIENRQTTASNLLSTLEQIMPRNMKVKTIALSEDGSVSFSAKAANSFAVADFISNLKSQKCFTNVEISGVEGYDSQPGSTSFAVNFKYVDGE